MSIRSKAPLLSLLLIWALTALVALLLFGCQPVHAQVPPPASTPLSGAEKITCIQNGQPRTCTAAELGSGGGGGSVSSVGLALPGSVFGVTGSPVTGSGTLTGTLNSQAANTVFAAPNGSSGTPTFRSVVGTDFGSQTAKNVLASPTGSNGVPSFRQLNANDTTFTSSGTGAVSQSLQSKLEQYVYPEDFGADNTCGSDAQPKLAQALTYAQSIKAVLKLRGCYRLSSSWTITGAAAIEGDSNGWQNPLSTYPTTIQCDQAVTPCVLLGDGTFPWSQRLSKVSITHAGTPSTTAEGLVVWSNQTVLTDVSLENHGVCLRLEESNQAGFAVMVDKMFTGNCRSYHIDVNGWAEARFNQSRFGQNGPSLYTSAAYVRVRGGVANTAGGPNTITFINSQFNEGDIGHCPTYFMDFVSLGQPGTNVDSGGVYLMASHVECVSSSGAIFHSDSTWPWLSNFKIIGSTFNTPSTAFFNLNGATGLKQWSIIGSDLLVSSFNLIPISGPLSYIYWAGGRQLGTTLIVAASGQDNQMSISGVTHGGNVAITGNWNLFSENGSMNTAGSLDYSGITGTVSITGPASHAVLVNGGVPTISSCGTSPAIDGRSRDNAGGFTTGTGTVTSCTITYEQPFPNMSFPTLVSASSGTPTYSLSATKTGFTVTFASNAQNTSWIWNVAGR